MVYRGLPCHHLKSTLKNWFETRKITKGFMPPGNFSGLILSIVTVGAEMVDPVYLATYPYDLLGHGGWNK